jgi:hypothetical protein
MDPAAVGVMPCAAIPSVGSSVILLGQCSDAGTDPASWLMLGMAAPSTAQPLVASGYNSTSTSTTSATFVALSCSAEALFYSPPSGLVEVAWRSGFDNNNADTRGDCGFEIRTGHTVGAGDVVVAATADAIIGLHGLEAAEFGATTAITTQLDPNAAHHIRTMYRRQFGTGSAFFARAEVIVRPQ